MSSKHPPPKWARHQIVAAYICGFLSLGYFTLQGVSEPLWGVHLDFGYIALVLAYISTAVIFNLKIPGWWRTLARLVARDSDEGDGDVGTT